MSRQLKGLLYFQAVNGKHSIIIFWSILISTTLISLLIAALTMTSGDSMAISFSAAIYIFAMFIGFNRVKYDVRYSLKLGATRKNIFVSTGLFFLGLSLVSALFISVIHQFITFLTSTFDIETYQLIHPATLLSDTWVNRLIIDSSLMFFFLTLLFIFGLVFYRFGLLGGGIAGAAIVILMLVGLGTGWIQDVSRDIVETLSIGFFFEVLLVGIGLYLISWFFLRRITVLMKN